MSVRHQINFAAPAASLLEPRRGRAPVGRTFEVLIGSKAGECEFFGWRKPFGTAANTAKCGNSCQDLRQPTIKSAGTVASSDHFSHRLHRRFGQRSRIAIHALGDTAQAIRTGVGNTLYRLSDLHQRSTPTIWAPGFGERLIDTFI